MDIRELNESTFLWLSMHGRARRVLGLELFSGLNGILDTQKQRTILAHVSSQLQIFMDNQPVVASVKAEL